MYNRTRELHTDSTINSKHFYTTISPFFSSLIKTADQHGPNLLHASAPDAADRTCDAARRPRAKILLPKKDHVIVLRSSN